MKNMAVRAFEGETWICGWFNRDGGLIDIQQYLTEREARETAEQFRGKYPTFVGRLEDVTDWESASKYDESSKRGTLASLSYSEMASVDTDDDWKYTQYLQLLVEVQKAGHDCHDEINQVLKYFKRRIKLELE
jgi:hypothetical protein